MDSLEVDAGTAIITNERLYTLGHAGQNQDNILDSSVQNKLMFVESVPAATILVHNWFR